MTKPVNERDVLDAKWINAVKLAGGVPVVRIPQEYTEANNLMDLLNRKLKLIQTIATVIHGRGDDYTVSTFEGNLLGGLNDYRNDVDFEDSPSTHITVSKAIMERLLLLRRFLVLAFDYFKLDGIDSPLYLTYMESVYPDFISWIHNQTDNLTET